MDKKTINTLKMRLAKGEISIDEYKQLISSDDSSTTKEEQKLSIPFSPQNNTKNEDIAKNNSHNNNEIEDQNSLKMRLAKGEISKDEYTQFVSALKSDNSGTTKDNVEPVAKTPSSQNNTANEDKNNSHQNDKIENKGKIKGVLAFSLGFFIFLLVLYIVPLALFLIFKDFYLSELGMALIKTEGADFYIFEAEIYAIIDFFFYLALFIIVVRIFFNLGNAKERVVTEIRIALVICFLNDLWRWAIPPEPFSFLVLDLLVVFIFVPLYVILWYMISKSEKVERFVLFYREQRISQSRFEEQSDSKFFDWGEFLPIFLVVNPPSSEENTEASSCPTEQYELTVNVSPSDCRIRITNVVYKPGICLKQGHYKLNVDECQSGHYETYSQSIEIKDRNVSIDVELRQIPLLELDILAIEKSESSRKAMMSEIEREKDSNRMMNLLNILIKESESIDDEQDYWFDKLSSMDFQQKFRLLDILTEERTKLVTQQRATTETQAIFSGKTMYLNGETEYMREDGVTFYNEKERGIVTGKWFAKGNNVCYHYSYAEKHHCFEVSKKEGKIIYGGKVITLKSGDTENLQEAYRLRKTLTPLELDILAIEKSESSRKAIMSEIKREKDTDRMEKILGVLIKETESMDDKERQYWFDILSSMDFNQKFKLLDILSVERRKLANLEQRYMEELEKLNAPVLYFSFDNGLSDDSENGNKIKQTVGQLKFVTGRKGKGLFLDGNSYLVGISNSLPMSDHDRTVCLYAKSNDSQETQSPNFAFSWGKSAGQSGYGLFEDGAPWVESDHWFTYTHCGQEPCDIDTQTRVTPNWQFLCSVYQKGKIINYIDGVKTSEAMEKIETKGNHFYIGTSPMQIFNFKGIIDEIVVYKSALNSNQINNLMKKLSEN